MVIHTIGDSHCISGWNKAINHHLGPILCYSFGNDTLNRCNIKNFNINEGDTVVFCLGEIDCRCHIHKHINNNISYQNIIDEIIKKYINGIKLIINHLNIKLKNVCVYNVVPPVEYPIKVFDEFGKEPFPHLGTADERKLYTLYFNKKLKELCIENNLIFIDIYENYIDKNGFLRYDLSDGFVHIKDDRFINKFILDHNL